MSHSTDKHSLWKNTCQQQRQKTCLNASDFSPAAKIIHSSFRPLDKINLAERSHLTYCRMLSFKRQAIKRWWKCAAWSLLKDAYRRTHWCRVKLLVQKSFRILASAVITSNAGTKQAQPCDLAWSGEYSETHASQDIEILIDCIQDKNLRICHVHASKCTAP